MKSQATSAGMNKGVGVLSNWGYWRLINVYPHAKKVLTNSQVRRLGMQSSRGLWRVKSVLPRAEMYVINLTTHQSIYQKKKFVCMQFKIFQ